MVQLPTSQLALEIKLINSDPILVSWAKHQLGSIWQAVAALDRNKTPAQMAGGRPNPTHHRPPAAAATNTDHMIHWPIHDHNHHAQANQRPPGNIMSPADNMVTLTDYNASQFTNRDNPPAMLHKNTQHIHSRTGLHPAAQCTPTTPNPTTITGNLPNTWNPM